MKPIHCVNCCSSSALKVDGRGRADNDFPAAKRFLQGLMLPSDMPYFAAVARIDDPFVISDKALFISSPSQHFLATFVLLGILKPTVKRTKRDKRFMKNTRHFPPTKSLIFTVHTHQHR